MKDQIQWTSPSPLWEKAISQSTAQSRRTELSRPAILRFATDTFMDDFLKMTENDPKMLSQYLALPETWRGLAPAPEAIKPVPAFGKGLRRLGLISARKKARAGGLVAPTDKFTAFETKMVSRPLKLYQPAHQRFYMISACLVCERPGLPDKVPDAAREEKVTYVVRRMFPAVDAEPNKPLPPPNATYEEYAYVITDMGPRWKKAANKNALETGEEQQALFSVSITEDDGRRRKLFAGLIPTGRREAYIAAGKFTEPGLTNTGNESDPDKPLDSRVYLMRAQFRDPWRNLLQTASYAKKAFEQSLLKEPGNADNIKARSDIVKTAREQIQTISWLTLLDFADFLKDNLSQIWDALKTPALSSELNEKEEKLYDVLTKTTLETSFATELKADTKYTDVSVSLAAALLAVKADDEIGKNLEKVVDSYDRSPARPPIPPTPPNPPTPLYPDFLFPLADPGYNPSTIAPVPNPSFLLKTELDGKPVSITPTNFLKTKLNQAIIAEANQQNQPVDETKLVRDGEDHVNAIARIIEDVLNEMPQNQPLMAPPLASQTPMDMREGWFVIRCIYERPLCGKIDPPVLSEPTRAFQIAGFFDPDAPARPIRIALPIDTTPAGLRKFDKNTAFMMSDLLCGQVNRMKGITFMDLVLSVLPFPFHKSLDVPDSGGCKQDTGLSIGMVCSLSIPIITICALILLIIIVTLLDFIFKWLPFLIFCFPLPGLKAKNE